MSRFLPTVLAAIPLLSLPALRAQSHDAPDASIDVDSDGDGLSDFHETYKYLTHPKKADSDGDGVPDGDWRERREFQYVIRSVVQVMKPVTPRFLNDDYQDARVLDEGTHHFELEVIHYPFNRVADAIRANRSWRKRDKRMKEWLRPGPTSDWTPKLRRELVQALAKDGIDVAKLDDRQVVERCSKWLCERAPHTSGCTVFVTAWNKSGKPFVPDEFQASLRSNLAERKSNLAQQWKRELSASGMFREKTRGTCTSSSIYLSGCLRALGIPTRTILCIPVLDASDPREFELLHNIENVAVRHHLRGSLEPLKNSWASHTFNEVWVGGRWRRLNYSRLGQGIYDRDFFGLLTHVATFRDWADAEFYKTVGRRQKTSQPKDMFGFNNPYSTISLRDEKGAHCKVELPTMDLKPMRIESVRWTDDDSLPKDIRDNCARRGRFGFIMVVTGYRGRGTFADFVKRCDRRVTLESVGRSKKRTKLEVHVDPGCYWASDERAHIYVAIQPGDRAKIRRKAKYAFRPVDRSAERGWQVSQDFVLTR